jgi:hypothetical protein
LNDRDLVTDERPLDVLRAAVVVFDLEPERRQPRDLLVAEDSRQRSVDRSTRYESGSTAPATTTSPSPNAASMTSSSMARSDRVNITPAR